MGPEVPRRPFLLGTRGRVLLVLMAAGLVSAWVLGLSPASLLPERGGRALAARFFSQALHPALDFESPNLEGSLLVTALKASWRTLVFAAAAMGLSILIGVVLGFFSSAAWWAGERAGGRNVATRLLRRVLLPGIYLSTRFLTTFMRSVHELFWAVLFLAAFGLLPTTGVLAISIPFGGTLAKIFSEMIDEAPREASQALRALGASPLQVFFFGLLPQALPDLTAYTFYRFECAMRSSAILGFFGFPTLGLYIRQSFESSYYGEVWTYLYALFLLVLAADWWSGTVRRRLSV